MIDAVAENDPFRALDILVQAQGNRLRRSSWSWSKTGVVGHVPARAQSRPAGGPHRLVAPAGSEENAPVGGANVVAGGTVEKGADGTSDKPPDNRPKGCGAKAKGKGKKGKARWK